MEPLVRTPRALAELTDDLDLTTYPPSTGDFLAYIAGISKFQVVSRLGVQQGGTGANALGWGDNKVVRYNAYSAVFDESLITIDDSGNLLTTGTMKSGGKGMAANVPITGKANASQSADLLNLTDSADDKSFLVDKYGVSWPFHWSWPCSTNSIDHDGYLYMPGNQVMAIDKGYPSPGDGSCIGLAVSVKTSVENTSGSNQTITFTVYYRGSGDETELCNLSVTVEDGDPAWTQYRASVLFNRGAEPYSDQDILMVKVAHTGGAEVKVAHGNLTFIGILDGNTEVTTIS